MQTLDEAWAWYKAASEGMNRLTHLAKFWGQFPWGSGADWIAGIEKDNLLRLIEPDEMAKDARKVDDELNDLAVLVLFSVFEANIRDLVKEQIRPEIEQLKHIFLIGTGEEALQRVTEGSFYHVLQPFKSVVSNDLIEQVNQVRQFRNWVAHGRRPLPPGKQMADVQPKEAYERLKQFLALIQLPI